MDAGAPSQPSRKLLGLRRSALLETALFLLATLVVDRFFFDGTRWRDLALHPFWMIVLLVAAQYGSAEGVVAAGSATVALLAGNLPEQAISQDRYEYLYQIIRLPVLWSIAALTLGEIRTRHVRERESLQRDLAATQAREQEFSQACERMRQIKEKLETKVASQMHSAIAMYHAARAIEKLETLEVLRGVAEAIRTVMKPEKFSVFLLKEDVLELTIHEGWESQDSYARVFTSSSALFREVVGAQRLVCSVRAGDEKILEAEGVLAGPLVSAETGEVFGLVKIEKTGFLNLNFNNVQTFRVLCQWIATAYSNARRYEAARSGGRPEPETQLLSYGLFSRYGAYVAELAKRIGFDLSLLVVRLENEDELPEDDRALIPAALAQAARSVLRKTDLAFEHQRSGYEYAVLLPDTPASNVAIVADKLLGSLAAELAGASRQPRFSSSVQCLNSRWGNHFLRDEVIPSQSDFLARLSRRAGFDLSLIEMRLANPEELSPETRDLVHAAVRRILDDFLAQGREPTSCVVSGATHEVFLAGVSVQAARDHADAFEVRVRKEIESCAQRARVVFTVHAINRVPRDPRPPEEVESASRA